MFLCAFLRYENIHLVKICIVLYVEMTGMFEEIVKNALNIGICRFKNIEIVFLSKCHGVKIAEIFEKKTTKNKRSG